MMKLIIRNQRKLLMPRGHKQIINLRSFLGRLRRATDTTHPGLVGFGLIGGLLVAIDERGEL